MTISVRRTPAATIMDLAGQLTLGGPTEALRGVVRSEVQASRALILNLAGVTYIDSAGLGQLVGCHATVAGAGGKMMLLNVQKKLHEMLQITHLYMVFEVFESEPAALSAFAA